MSELSAPTPFVEYEVPGVGTVIDPQGEPGYRVRRADGRVTAYPAQSGDPNEANAAADIAYAIANPVVPPPVRRQETRIVLDRLTDPERAALFDSSNTGVRTLVAKALATGAIRDDDPEFSAAVAGLDALGIVASSRWEALLAP